MKEVDLNDLSADEWDEKNDPRPETCDFNRVVERALTRRGMVGGILAFGSGAAVVGTGSLLDSSSAQAMETSRFPFAPIGIKTDGTVHVPEGYSWDILARWGDPLFSHAPEFDHATSGDADSADRVCGENTDGMELFVVDGREVITVNHEYSNLKVNLPQNGDGTPASLDDVRKLQKLQGVSVMEIIRGADGWEVIVDSPLNRRITHLTPMRISGPAAGHDLLKTDADQTGKQSLGTFNNCGSGKTPWGTYLTCEENFNGYFGSTDKEMVLPGDFVRYGVGHDGWGYEYHAFDPRFDISQNPNEPRRAGYIVEIDQSDAGSVSVKHTGLGRFKHEIAACTLAPDSRVVVDMGDDEPGDFLFKFVSNGVFTPGGDAEDLLDNGRLYVATFLYNGSGQWVELTEEATGMTEADICIFTRVAASKVGATTMDRPEWVALNPVPVEAYCCLTNNKNGGIKPNKGGDETPVGGPNPRAENKYGQIARW